MKTTWIKFSAFAFGLFIALLAAAPAEAQWACLGSYETAVATGTAGTCSGSEANAANAAWNLLGSGNICYSRGQETCNENVVFTQNCLNIGGGVCEAKAKITFGCLVCTRKPCPL
jgi:hypothetical protein